MALKLLPPPTTVLRLMVMVELSRPLSRLGSLGGRFFRLERRAEEIFWFSAGRRLLRIRTTAVQPR